MLRQRRWALVVVSGLSMSPTLRPGDCLLVRNGGPVRAGDIVVVTLPGRPLGVKRAIRRVAGGWWIEGDNPGASTDSRHFGPVPDSAVQARVLWRYWPLRRLSA